MTDGLVFRLFYVGDILLSGGDITAIEDAKKQITRELTMTYLGLVITFVGIQRVRETDMGRIRLRQETY